MESRSHDGGSGRARGSCRATTSTGGRQRRDSLQHPAPIAKVTFKASAGLSFVADDTLMFRAGGTRSHLIQWRELTSDKFILQAVTGVALEFDEVPMQRSQPQSLQFAKYEYDVIDKQIDEYLRSGIVQRVDHSQGEFISNVFIRDKKNGAHRLILNLINFNPFITYHHFKMDTIDAVINIM